MNLKMKKILAGLLAAMMMASCAPVSVLAADEDVQAKADATVDYVVQFEEAVLENSGTAAYTIDSSVDATDVDAVKAAVKAILETAHADLLKTWDPSTMLTSGVSITYYDILDTTLATEYEAGSVTVKISFKDDTSGTTYTETQSVEATFILAQTGTTSADRFAEFEAEVAALSGTAATQSTAQLMQQTQMQLKQLLAQSLLKITLSF